MPWYSHPFVYLANVCDFLLSVPRSHALYGQKKTRVALPCPHWAGESRKSKGVIKLLVYLLQLSCIRGEACRGKSVRGLRSAEVWCWAERGEIIAAATTFTVALPMAVTSSSMCILLWIWNVVRENGEVRWRQQTEGIMSRANTSRLTNILSR